MITAEELVQVTDNTEEQKSFKLATVVDLFENATAKVLFDGEEEPSEKQYSYLDSYIPSKGDRTLLGALGGTYIILGKINYNVSPPVEEEIDRYLFDLKQVIIQKGLSVTGDAVFDSTETNTFTANTSSLGNAEANDLKTSSLTTENLQANGNTTFNGAVTLNSGLTAATGTWMECSNLRTRGTFQHNGNYAGFYGKAAVARQFINTLASNADLVTVKNKVNELINKLAETGLIG